MGGGCVTAVDAASAVDVAVDGGKAKKDGRVRVKAVNKKSSNREMAHRRTHHHHHHHHHKQNQKRAKLQQQQDSLRVDMNDAVDAKDEAARQLLTRVKVAADGETSSMRGG